MQNRRDIVCRSHTSRSEKELYRLCPTKLTKREFEDLYYALLDNNMNLKRTVNEQQDSIKILSTKVQRLISARKSVCGKEMNECCRSVQILANEQKESITELKIENTRLSERVRLLNMRLCSAKQFTKRSPLQARCTKCSIAQTNSFKNTSTSALNLKLSDTNIKSTIISYQSIPKEIALSSRTVDTDDEKSVQSDHTEKQCKENKCQTLIEELKQKIGQLNEELSSAHEDYATRISKLETEISSSKEENLRSRGLRAAADHELEDTRRKSEQFKSALRASEANNNELSLQLSIEKRKVAELETQLKAAEMSNQVARTIQEHITSINENRQTTLKETIDKLLSPRYVIESVSSPLLEVPTTSIKPLENSEARKKDETRVCASSDDSGYIDLNKSTESTDDKAMNKLNQELLKKISELQMQLDRKKISEVKKNVSVTKDDISSSTPEKSSFQIKNAFVETTGENVYSCQEISSLNNTNLSSNNKKDIEVKSELCSTKETKNSHIPKPVGLTKEKCNKIVKTEDNETKLNKEETVKFISNDTERHTEENVPETEIEKDNAKEKVSEGLTTENTDSTAKTNIQEKSIIINCETPKKTVVLTTKQMSKDLNSEMKIKSQEFTEERNSNLQLKSSENNVREQSKIINDKKKINDVHKKKDSGEKPIQGTRKSDQTPEDSPRTYTVYHSTGKHRTYSVDHDTDNEISDLTDLPTEIDDKSPRCILSPGEERPKCYTDSYTTLTDYSSLSEGELPTVGARRRFSEGEKKPFIDPVEESSPERMEATLKAINNELARCKRLLNYRKPDVVYPTTVT